MNFYIDVNMRGSMMIDGANVNDAEAKAKDTMWWFATMLFDLYYAKKPEEQATLAGLMHERMQELQLMFDSDVEIKESK